MNKNPDYAIRPARLEDLEAVVGLWDELIASHSRYIREVRRTKANREMMAEHLKAIIAHDQVLVLESEGKVLGFSAVTVRPPVLDRHFLAATITDLCIAKACRGRGWGRALLDATIEMIRERGVHAIDLTVVAGNQAARALYKSVGFRSFKETFLLPLDDTLVRFGPDAPED